MFDFTAISRLKSFFAQWLESEGRELTYLQRYTQENNPFGNCPRCLDEIDSQITDNNCPICYGTGYQGGYGLPITGSNSRYQRVYGLFMKGSLNTDWQEPGIITGQQNQQCYINLNFDPALSDLIIDNNGVRYRVGNVIDIWAFNGVNVGYIITVFQMPSEDTLYTVPIPTYVNLPAPNRASPIQINVYNKYAVKIAAGSRE